MTISVEVAVQLIEQIQTEGREPTNAEIANVVDAGVAVSQVLDRERRVPTSDERLILDTCQSIRQSDGPNVQQIWICIPGGGDESATEFLRKHVNDS